MVLQNEMETFLSEFEEPFCIVIGYVLNHLLNARHFGCGDFTFLYVITYQIAQYAAEILMAGI